MRRIFLPLIFLLSLYTHSCKKEDNSIKINSSDLPEEVYSRGDVKMNVIIKNLPEGSMTAYCTFNEGIITHVNGGYSPSGVKMASSSKDELSDQISIRLTWRPEGYGYVTMTVFVLGMDTQEVFRYTHSINVIEDVELTIIGESPLQIDESDETGVIEVKNEKSVAQRIYYRSDEKWIDIEYPSGYSDEAYTGGILLQPDQSLEVLFDIRREYAYSGLNAGTVIFSMTPLGTHQETEVNMQLEETSRLKLFIDNVTMFCWKGTNSETIYIEKTGFGSMVWTVESSQYFTANPSMGDATQSGGETEILVNCENLAVNVGGIIEDSLRFLINESSTVALPLTIYNFGIYWDFINDPDKLLTEAADWDYGLPVEKMAIVGCEFLPEEWMPEVLEEVQIVGNLRTEQQLIETCTYGGGVYVIKRYQYFSYLSLYNAKTHKLVYTETFEGSRPSSCPSTTSSSKTYIGDRVPDETIIQYLNRLR